MGCRDEPHPALAGGVLWKVLTRAMGKKDRQEDTVGREPHQGPGRP